MSNYNFKTYFIGRFLHTSEHFFLRDVPENNEFCCTVWPDTVMSRKNKTAPSPPPSLPPPPHRERDGITLHFPPFQWSRCEMTAICWSKVSLLWKAPEGRHSRPAPMLPHPRRYHVTSRSAVDWLASSRRKRRGRREGNRQHLRPAVPPSRSEEGTNEGWWQALTILMQEKKRRNSVLQPRSVTWQQAC